MVSAFVNLINERSDRQRSKMTNYKKAVNMKLKQVVDEFICLTEND